MLSEPVPRKLQPFLPAMESFIVNQWLPLYPDGARLRKLQRDVAWRMDRKESPGKLEYDKLLPIVGELARKGLIKTRAKSGGVLVVMPPDDKEDCSESGA